MSASGIYTIEAVRAVLYEDNEEVMEVIQRYLAEAATEDTEDIVNACGVLLRDALNFSAALLGSLAMGQSAVAEDILDHYALAFMEQDA